MLPSELLARKQFFFQCGEENTTERDVELLGDDCLLWASDFPTKRHEPISEHWSRNFSTAEIYRLLRRTKSPAPIQSASMRYK
jgi:hypothetical protein